MTINAESYQRLFQGFCKQPTEVDVLKLCYTAAIAWNLQRCPFLRKVNWVVDLDLLFCTGFDLEYVDLFLCHIVYVRVRN